MVERLEAPLLLQHRLSATAEQSSRIEISMHIPSYHIGSWVKVLIDDKETDVCIRTYDEETDSYLITWVPETGRQADEWPDTMISAYDLTTSIIA